MLADELMSTLQKMHDKKMYGELVFYLETCESGSMFKNLPTNINVFAESAADAKESSWGTYCHP
jgi:legumain